MNRLSKRLLVFTVGAGASAAMALTFSGPAMASESTTHQSGAHAQQSHQPRLHQAPRHEDHQARPPAHQPRGHQRSDHRRPPCKVRCPKATSKVTGSYTTTTRSVVKRGHDRFVKATTYRVTTVKRAWYTVEHRKCVKHVSSTQRRHVISVRYLPVHHRPVIVKKPAQHAEPIAHASGHSVPAHAA